VKYEFQPTCQIPPEILDKIYLDSFGYKTNGTLVEIGAHDGWHWSNTWGLAKIGWRAVFAEPVPELYRECCRTHAHHPGRISVRKCCIGPTNGRAFLGMGEYGASLDAKDATFETTQYTLDDFLKSNHVPPRFDLLVIDVEGGEAGVLAGFTLANWLPKLIIIERPPVPNKILDAGYTQVYSDWINTVYEYRTAGPS
jgi:FkbM family methyltransferase